MSLVKSGSIDWSEGISDEMLCETPDADLFDSSWRITGLSQTDSLIVLSEKHPIMAGHPLSWVIGYDHENTNSSEDDKG